VAAYRDLYIRVGSPGLADWTRSRLADERAVMRVLLSRGWTAEQLQQASDARSTDSSRAAFLIAADPLLQQSGAELLAATVARRPRFYAGLRRSTLALDSLGGAVAQIRAEYRRLAALYPDAVFPPVYFLIGRLTSGGTTGPSGILIGAEMHAATATTPRDELTAWQRAVVGDVKGVPRVVAHELVHVQQEEARRFRGATPAGAASSAPILLAQALEEGCADLLADVMVGSPDSSGNIAYGLAHERELWRDFQRAMLGTDTKGWLYEGDAAKNRPADLGYFIGARICRAYYERAPDKRQAVRDILVMDDPKAFLQASGYKP
jgi:hypothetical protein